MNLTKRDKIVHLLNRFGLGAAEHEVETYSAYGVDGAIHRLIDYQAADDDFNVQSSEFFFDPQDKLTMDSGRVPAWWILRLITTQRPGQEKLTLFWHSHFAVSGSKVDYGPMMVDYLDVLRNNANGSFATLLERVSKSPAMVRWLDIDKSLKGRPNENFAREVMELFTLGIGNYTEKDVQEAARAFSGWSIRYTLGELGGMPQLDRARFAYEHDLPPACFQDAPEMHDNGHKTVLGETGPLTAEDILTKLANHPKTAERLARKLWSFYGYHDPEPELVHRLASRYTQSGGQIKSLLYAIAEAPEFWSEKAVGTMVKSPVDFCIGALRQVNAGVQLAAKRSPEAKFDTPMDRALLGDLYSVRRSLNNQGLSPLFPPDVSGWQWGAVWATPAAMLERAKFQDYVFNAGVKGGPPSAYFLDRLIAGHKTDTPEGITRRILQAMAVTMPEEKVAILVDQCKKAGGAKTLVDRRRAAPMVRRIVRLVYGSPEYQLS